MDAFRTAFHTAFSTPLIADSAFRQGTRVGVVGPMVRPLTEGYRIAGPAVTVEANNDLVAILLALHRAPAGSVLVIGNKAGGPAGLTGDIIASEARRKGIQAIVVDGFIRDSAEIRRIGQPVFSRGCIPVGPLKLAPEQKGVGELGVNVQCGDVLIEPGQWLLGDDDGLLVLDPSDLPSILEQAYDTLKREEALVARLQAGTSLGDVFGIEAFARKREQDPDADFNAHLAEQGDAI